MQNKCQISRLPWIPWKYFSAKRIKRINKWKKFCSPQKKKKKKKKSSDRMNDQFYEKYF